MVAACSTRPAAIADPPHRCALSGVEFIVTRHVNSEHFSNDCASYGWIENQSLLIEWRFSEGSAAPLARLATELVEKNVEVIVTTPTQPTIAAKHATSTIPIVYRGGCRSTTVRHRDESGEA